MTLMADEVHVAYCREARRLRCVHARRPARMYREIAGLSAKYNAMPRPASESAPAALVAPPKPIAAVAVRISPRPIFAEKVSAELAGDLAGDVLTYSKRQALLNEAGRMGIGRFEANLVIAEEQHRSKVLPVSGRPVGSSRLGLIAVALAVELLAALVLYHLFV
ncbi:MAG TPA: hypothetical protein VHY37_10045 [Tepidisphaeraceae bacterium]|jgi:hypothetical protein|nr:hypothetical protein [Tepidisphaeraceae bacterium]